MASSKIVFFDLPSKDPIHAWSLNTWKTRLILNYKGIDYETEWLEYPEIKPRLQPHFPDNEEFTVPTVKMPDGTYIMDSLVIARELEKQYPSPDLQIDSPLRQKYMDELSKTFGGLRPEYILRVPNILLNEVNHDYWHRTRSEYVGMPLEKFVEEGSGEQAFQKAAPFLQNMTAMLKENDKGVFFLGDTISYVDFCHAGFLVMFRRLGDDIFNKVLEATGDPEVHLKFLEGLEPWIKRDNY
ncbi:putative glutathione S-transferase [Nemania sp. FL0031]|nr:putative glutathione S-transferase [Nemania sp. FL0031]